MLSVRRATVNYLIAGFDYWLFLSTPSVRRATQAGEVHRYGRPISIHALREEGDGKLADEVIIVREFLSTPSARRATLCASALA